MELQSRKIKKNSYWLKVFICLLGFGVFSGPRLTLIDVHLACLLVLSVVSVFFYNSMRIYYFSVFTYILFSFYILTLFIFRSGSGDTELIIFLVKYVLYYHASASFIILFKAAFSNVDFAKLLSSIVIFSIPNAAFVPSMLLPEFRAFLLPYFAHDEFILYYASVGIRFLDLVIGGQATAAVWFGFLSVCILVLYLKNKIGHLQLFVLFFLFLTASILCGRSGLLIIGTGIILTYVFTINKITIRHIIFFIYLLTGICSIVALLYSYIESNKMLEWILEPIYVMLGLKANVDSISVLKNMIMLPEDIWFGEGVFSRKYAHNIESDIGYVFMLFGFGIIGTVIVAINFFIFTSISVTLSVDRYEKVIIYFVISTFFIFNFKELFLLPRLSVFGFFTVMLFNRIQSRKYDHENR